MLDMRAHPMVEKAEKAVQTQEVQEILQRLSELGLGVFMPHIHNRDGFSPLPDNIVQLEGDLEITFVNQDDPKGTRSGPCRLGVGSDVRKSCCGLLLYRR